MAPPTGPSPVLCNLHPSSQVQNSEILKQYIQSPFMAVLSNGLSILTLRPPLIQSPDRRHLHSPLPIFRHGYFPRNAKLKSNSRIKSFQHDDSGKLEASKSEVTAEDQYKDSDIDFEHLESKTAGNGSSFLSKLGIVLGLAAVITLVSVTVKPPNHRTSLGIQFLSDGSSSTTLAAPAGVFNFRAFGYRVVLPEYAPGWIYFWLLMAAGCGLFISEEALNIWVGISLARLLYLDGTRQSLINSISKNAPYMISTVVWVYWGVCISDMIPFYIGKFFRQSGASNDILSKLGVGKEKAIEITNIVNKYGNLIGFVERFSLGVRNPTAFMAGAMGISPECFFAGVCFGGLVTLPLQLGIGFLLRERPVFALATVATVVGIWTLFPYAVAALTALFLYVRRRYSS